MASSHLTPTRIINKNGVATTVHKKPQSNNSSIAIPAPDLNMAQPVTDHLMDRIDLALNHWLQSVPEMVDRTRVKKNLEALPEDIKRLLVDAAERHPKDNRFDNIVISMLHMNRSPRDMDDILYCYENTKDIEMMLINDFWTDLGFDAEYGIVASVDWCRQYNERLNNYEFRTTNDSIPLREYDENTRAQVVALIDFTSRLAETGNLSYVSALHTTTDEKGSLTLQITDTSLAQLIVDMPERYEEIMATIEERRTLDADLLRTILTNDAVSLNDGVI